MRYSAAKLASGGNAILFCSLNQDVNCSSVSKETHLPAHRKGLDTTLVAIVGERLPSPDRVAASLDNAEPYLGRTLQLFWG